MEQLEQIIKTKMWIHKREHGREGAYLICDLDTRFEIMNNLKDATIHQDKGTYIIYGLTICIVDGLTNKTILEVK